MTNNENKSIDFQYTDEFKKQVDHFFSRPVSNYKKRQDAIKVIKNKNIGGATRFRTEEVQRWMQNPAGNEENFRKLSLYLFQANSLYRWFVSILANMPTWSWTLSMDVFSSKKNKDQLNKIYRQGTQYGDKKFNLHELNKAFAYVMLEDWFYGYEIESDDSYFILKLDPKFCRVTSIVENGIKAFQFDMSFFDDKQDANDNNNNIVNSYPDEFKKGYAKYLRTGKKWFALDPINTICWKLQDELPYGMPYFINLFPSLSDIGFFKDVEKAKAEIDSFLLLHQHIPLDEAKMNKFAIDLGLAADFDAMAADNLPDGVAMFTSPMKITAVKTERGGTDKDKVKNAIDQTYTGAGLPQQLGNANTAVGLSKAIMANEQIIYKFYKQVAQTMNFKIKYKYPNMKFTFKILEFTHFSREDKASQLLTGAQNGVVDAMHAASAQGINPYEFLNNIELEEVLNIVDRLKPLQTSYTLSSKDKQSGAPTKDDDKLSDSGIATRENDSNNERG